MKMLNRQPIDHTASVGHDVKIGYGVVIERDCVVGPGSILGNGVVLRERSVVGNHVVIGHHTVLGGYCYVGDRSLVSTHCSVTRGAIVEEDCFIAMGVIMTNDKIMVHLRRDAVPFELSAPIVRRGARIGAGAILLPGVEIGEEAKIAAGCVVSQDALPRSQYIGVPGRWAGEIGEIERLYK